MAVLETLDNWDSEYWDPDTEDSECLQRSLELSEGVAVKRRMDERESA